MRDFLFSRLAQDKHNSVPLIQKTLYAHAQIAASWIGQIDTIPSHSPEHGKMIVAEWPDMNDHRSQQLWMLANGQLKARSPITLLLSPNFETEEGKPNPCLASSLLFSHRFKPGAKQL